MEKKVAEVMSRKVQTIAATQSVREAAALMRDHGVGMVVVMEKGTLAGVLTDRDIAVRVVADGLNPDEMTAGAAASEKVVVCRVDHSLFAARALMEENVVRRLVVTDHQGKLAGVISVEDLATVAGGQAALGTLVEHLARPLTKA